VAEHTFAGLRCSEVADLGASFVLGALEDAESDAVRRHLASCPEAHPEMAELHSVVPALFGAVELQAPPAGLKDRILAAAAADTQRATDTRRVTQLVTDTQRAVDTQRAAIAPPRILERQPVLERQQVVPPRDGGWAPGLFRRPVWAALAIAATFALVALGAWNVQLTQRIDQLTAYRNGVVAVLDQAAQPGAQLAVLTKPEGSGGPSGLAAVSGAGSTVSMVMRDLAPTSGSQVYVAWLIAGDNAPVAIGHFTVDASGTAAMSTSAPAPGAAPALTVALTLETDPGVTAPHGAVVVAGVAQAATS